MARPGWDELFLLFFCVSAPQPFDPVAFSPAAAPSLNLSAHQEALRLGQHGPSSPWPV